MPSGPMKYNPDMAERYGGHRRQAALTEDEILEVYDRFHGGEAGYRLAAEYGVGQSTVYRIGRGEAYTDITKHGEQENDSGA